MKKKRKMKQENDIRKNLGEFVDYFDIFYYK